MPTRYVLPQAVCRTEFLVAAMIGSLSPLMSKKRTNRAPSPGSIGSLHSRNPKYFQGSPVRDQFPDEVEESFKTGAGRRWEQIAGVAQLTRALPA